MARKRLRFGVVSIFGHFWCWFAVCGRFEGRSLYIKKTLFQKKRYVEFYKKNVIRKLKTLSKTSKFFRKIKMFSRKKIGYRILSEIYSHEVTEKRVSLEKSTISSWKSKLPGKIHRISKWVNPWIEKWKES